MQLMLHTPSSIRYEYSSFTPICSLDGKTTNSIGSHRHRLAVHEATISTRSILNSNLLLLGRWLLGRAQFIRVRLEELRWFQGVQAGNVVKGVGRDVIRLPLTHE